MFILPILMLFDLKRALKSAFKYIMTTPDDKKMDFK